MCHTVIYILKLSMTEIDRLEAEHRKTYYIPAARSIVGTRGVLSDRPLTATNSATKISMPHLGMVYLKSWGMRKIGLGGLYVKLSVHVFGVSHTWTPRSTVQVTFRCRQSEL